MTYKIGFINKKLWLKSGLLKHPLDVLSYTKVWSVICCSAVYFCVCSEPNERVFKWGKSVLTVQPRSGSITLTNHLKPVKCLSFSPFHLNPFDCTCISPLFDSINSSNDLHGLVNSRWPLNWPR